MRLTDHITLNFNNEMSTAAVFLDEKSFDTLLHPGLLYKLSTMEFSTSLSQRKFRVLVESKMPTPRDIKAGVPQGFVMSPTLYNLYINDTLQTIGVNLALFADDTSLHVTERKEGYVPRKLQHVPNSMVAWCKHWSIKINEEKTRAVYFSH
jgi:hypothetical protein